MSKKSDIIFMARIAEKAERYNEMKEYMHQVASTPDPETGKVDLTSEERNLLPIAYKNVVNNKRVSWRILSQHSQKENAPYLQDIIEFMNKVEKELKDVCQEILSLLEDYLIPGAKDGSQKVFYWKLKGDYYRYVCEFEKDEKKDETKTKAREAYQKAMDIGQEEHLESTNPIMLGLALNFSVFYYEIEEDSQKACDLAREAYNGAVAGFESLSENDYKDTTLIMQLLRDNLTLWGAGTEMSQ